ncbi:MAG: VacJ family lipoprotein [bacterium]|nr:VacJ family lipoprotein [bacterium]
MSRLAWLGAALGLGLCLAGGAPPAHADESAPEVERPATAAPAAAQAQTPAEVAPQIVEYDPWEGFNRKIFAFNDGLDTWVLEPTARGWAYITPQPMRTGFSNFFNNLRFPVNFVNNVFQLKLFDASQDVARFVVNTAIGGAGFLDPASDLGLRQSYEDFGQTMAHWGTPAGPYFVLPILGPSTVRDTAGLPVDAAATIYPFFVSAAVTIGPRILDVINTRAAFLSEVAEAKEASFDYYVFVRNAYLQRRQALIEDRAEKDKTYDDSLYEIVD